MNKKGQQRDWSGIVFFVVIAFLLAGVLIYFLGNLAIWLGFAGVIISLLVLYIAGQENNEEGIRIGLFILVLSILLIIGGFAITSFFENNEIGISWLGGGKDVIDTTSEAYKNTKEALP